MDAEPLEIRDSREPKHFWADNELVDDYLPTIGVYGFAVYMLLCRYAYYGKADPSISTIADRLGIAKNTVRAALNRLIEVGLIARAKRPTENPKVSDTNLYTILKLKGVVHQMNQGSSPDEPGVVHQMNPLKTQDQDSTKQRIPETHVSAQQEPIKTFELTYRHPVGKNVKAQDTPHPIGRSTLNNPSPEQPKIKEPARDLVFDAFTLMLRADTPELVKAKASKIGLYKKSWIKLCPGVEDLTAFDFVAWVDEPGQANGFAHKLKSVASLEAYIGDWLASLKPTTEAEYTVPEPDDSLYTWSKQ